MAESKTDKRVQMVLGHYDRSSSWRKNNFETTWSNDYKLWKSYRKDKDVGRANLFVPKPFELVEMATALLMGIAFPKRPYANYKPRPGTQGSAQKAKEATQFTDYQLNEQMQILITMNAYIKNMVGMGTAFMKIGWQRELGQVRTREPQSRIAMTRGPLGVPIPTVVTELVEVEKTVALQDNPYAERISIWDAYPHPNEVAGLRRKLPFIHKRVITLEELKAFNPQGEGEEPIYTNLDKVEKMGSWVPDESTVKPKSEMGASKPEPANKGEGQDVELLEWIGERGQRIITLANREVVVRDQRNPFYHGQMPVVSTPFILDQEDCVYGMSLLDPGFSLFMELNDLRNQIMDNVNLALKAPMVADYDRLEDPDNTIFAPDNIIEVRGRPDDVIKKLDVPDYTGRGKDMDGIIKGDIQSYSSITEIASGIGTEGLQNDTASGMSMLLEQLNKRQKPVFDLLQETCIKPLLFQMRHLNHQFLDQGFYPGKEGDVEVTHEHFKHEYDIECTGSVTYTSKAVRFQQAKSLFDSIGAHPNVHPLPLIQEMLEMADYSNIDEILEPNPQPPADDVKYQYVVRADMTPDQSAQVLEKNGIETSEEDLMGQNIDRLNKMEGQNNSIQRAIDGPPQSPERSVHDESARGAKQTANTSGT